MKIAIFAGLFFAILGVTPAQETEIPAKVRVGVYEKPPYAERGPDGRWGGMAVDMWSAIAGKLGTEYEFVELRDRNYVSALKNGVIDAMLGEVNLRSAPEREIDFSHSFFGANLGVASLPGEWSPDWVVILRGVFNRSMVSVILIVIALLFVISVFLWLVENRGHLKWNREKRIQFSDMCWFALATLTTVGSSERGPRTWPGRLVGAAWMLASVLLVAAFTASVASSVAAASVMAERNPDSDLYNKRIAVVAEGLAEDYLTDIGVHPVPADSIREGLLMLRRGDVDLFIGDMLSTSYISQHEFGGRFLIARFGWVQGAIGFAFPQDSPWLKHVNIALLEVAESEDWHRNVSEWTGGLPAVRTQLGDSR